MKQNTPTQAEISDTLCVLMRVLARQIDVHQLMQALEVEILSAKNAQFPDNSIQLLKEVHYSLQPLAQAKNAEGHH